MPHNALEGVYCRYNYRSPVYFILKRHLHIIICIIVTLPIPAFLQAFIHYIIASKMLKIVGSIKSWKCLRTRRHYVRKPVPAQRKVKIQTHPTFQWDMNEQSRWWPSWMLHRHSWTRRNMKATISTQTTYRRSNRMAYNISSVRMIRKSTFWYATIKCRCSLLLINKSMRNLLMPTILADTASKRRIRTAYTVSSVYMIRNSNLWYATMKCGYSLLLVNESMRNLMVRATFAKTAKKRSYSTACTVSSLRIIRNPNLHRGNHFSIGRTWRDASLAYRILKG